MKALRTLAPSLISFLGAAALLPLQAVADVGAEPPLETNTTALVVFGVLFVGFCVGILWMMWKGSKKKQDAAGSKG